jgi:hypothetical protein
MSTSAPVRQRRLRRLPARQRRRIVALVALRHGNKTGVNSAAYRRYTIAI